MERRFNIIIFITAIFILGVVLNSSSIQSDGSGGTTYGNSSMNQTPNMTAGSSSTINVNWTFTNSSGTQALVLNRGNSSAAILDFYIPKGDTGANGSNGETNLTPNMTANMTAGPAGAPGAANMTAGPAGAANMTSNKTPNMTANMTAGPAGAPGAANMTANMTAGPAGAANMTANMTRNMTMGSNGVNGSLWYSGEGSPSESIGLYGDYYLNLLTGDVYYNNGMWGAAGGGTLWSIMGPQGIQGEPGVNGDPGLAGTITVENVYTGEPGTDVIITNYGTPEAALLDITIPAGYNGTSNMTAGPAGAANMTANMTAGPPGSLNNTGIVRVDVNTTTTSATGINVSQLSFVVAPNSAYTFSGYLHVNSSRAGGTKFGFWIPSGALFTSNLFGTGTSATTHTNSFISRNATTLNAIVFGSAANLPYTFVQIEGSVKTGANGGNITLIEAVGATTGSQVSSVNYGSYIQWFKLSTYTTG